MQLRKLTATDVTFSVRIEAEDQPVRGAFQSGDPDYAEQATAMENDIIERLDRGEVEAWCGVIVTATWEGHEGEDAIWGCSLDDSYTTDVVVSEHGMRDEALDRLNEAVAKHAVALSRLAV